MMRINVLYEGYKTYRVPVLLRDDTFFDTASPAYIIPTTLKIFERRSHECIINIVPTADSATNLYHSFTTTRTRLLQNHALVSSMMMELYACGFNAWNQLLFGGNLSEEPYDLWQFQRTLEDQFIDIWRAGFTSTLVRTTSGVRLAGMPDELAKHVQAASNCLNFAEAGNGKVAVSHDQADSKILEYKSWTDYPDRPCGEWDIGKVKQLVAGRTTFTALSATGDVWTWGDERYQACLGRDIGRGASEPGLVTDLQSLPTGPIARIASGAYVTAALTAEQDLYLWGADEVLSLDGQAAPLDLGDVDVVDVAVGDSHVIILTSDGKLLVIGKGKNGQMGVGKGVEEVPEWREVDLKLDAGSVVLRVVAGPRCSFVLVRNDT